MDINEIHNKYLLVKSKKIRDKYLSQISIKISSDKYLSRVHKKIRDTFCHRCIKWNKNSSVININKKRNKSLSRKNISKNKTNINN